MHVRAPRLPFPGLLPEFPMPRYQCPECEAVLKRDTAVEEGKKIKCPKCEVIFKAKAMRPSKEEEEEEKEKAKKKDEKKAKAAAGAPAAGAEEEEEEEGGTYSVIKEPEDPEAEARRKEINYGSLRDKFEKSKRGPAMAETVRPSNFILMQGIIDCIAGVGLLMVMLWPFIFSEETPRGSAARNKILFMVLGVFIFAIGCLISYGASKLQSLESYNWAMTGCILAAISLLPTGAAGGIWGIVVLKDEDVIAGFEETKDARDY
jgi:DNA-directed RNA polymerase subunit M/transcription elongation factor TFIIS